MQTHQFRNHCTNTHNLPQWEGWDCLSLQSLSILGVIGDRQTLKSSSTLSRALHFVFIAIMAEKDVSQRYVVGKGSNILMAWRAISLYSFSTVGQNSAGPCWLNLILRVRSLDSSKSSSSAFPLRPPHHKKKGLEPSHISPCQCLWSNDWNVHSVRWGDWLWCWAWSPLPCSLYPKIQIDLETCQWCLFVIYIPTGQFFSWMQLFCHLPPVLWNNIPEWTDSVHWDHWKCLQGRLVLPSTVGQKKTVLDQVYVLSKNHEAHVSVQTLALKPFHMRATAPLNGTVADHELLPSQCIVLRRDVTSVVLT